VRRLLPLVLVLLLALPAPAHARRVIAHGAFGGLAVAGDAVAWSDVSRPGARLRVKRPGSASKLVFSQQVPRGETGGLETLAASPTRVAIIVSEQRGDEESENFRLTQELRAGPLDGPLTRVVRGAFLGVGCEPAPTDAAVAADVLVWIEKTCPSGARVLARDLAGGGADRQLTQMAYLADLTAADRFVAWVQGPAEPSGFPAPGEIVVYDLVANAESYRVPADPSRLIRRIDVQADGKLLVQGVHATPGTGAQQGEFLDWYSPAEPTPHPLSVRSAFTFPALGGDRVLLSRFASRTTDELVLSDLNSALTTLARFPRRTLGITVAFDGRTAVYVEEGCADDTLFAQDVPESGAIPETTVTSCPVRIQRGTILVPGGRTARVKLSCTRGCDGTAELRAGGRRIAPMRHFHFAGTSGRVPFTLDSRARRALRRAGSLRATVTVHNQDRNFKARRTVGRIVLDP
jgi:hypothetical protein